MSKDKCGRTLPVSYTFSLLGETWGYTAWSSGEPNGHGGFMAIYGAPAFKWDWLERKETDKFYSLCES